jgi:hypothetical protein
MPDGGGREGLGVSHQFHECGGVEDRHREIQGPEVRCHLELGLPGPNAAALDAWAGSALDELGNPHSLGHLGDLLSLPHLFLIATEVVVLHAEDAMDAIEGTLQGHRIRRVGLDDLGTPAGRGRGPCFRPGSWSEPEPTNGPAAGGGSPPHPQAGRPHHRDHPSVVLRHRCRPPAKTSLSDEIQRTPARTSPIRHLDDRAPGHGVALLTTPRAVFKHVAWPPAQLMSPPTTSRLAAAILVG